jgi:hypothetical protein
MNVQAHNFSDTKLIIDCMSEIPKGLSNPQDRSENLKTCKGLKFL